MTSLRALITLCLLSLMLSGLLLTSCGKPTLETIDIEPSSVTSTVGQTLQFRAIGRDTKGRPMEEVSFTWSVDNSIGHIDAQGLFRAVKPGTVTVSASAGNVKSDVTVTILRQTAAKLVSSRPPNVIAGQQAEVTITVQSTADQGIVDVEVHASAMTKGTQVSPKTATTDASGHATFSITTAPEVSSNRVRFKADEKDMSLVVDTVPGPPASLLVSAEATEVVAGEPVMVHVTVQDQNHNPVPKAQVTLTPVSGAPPPVEQPLTDDKGQTDVVVRTGPKAGVNQFSVSVGDLEPQTLVIQGVPGPPAQITLQGESQETVAGGAVKVSALVHDTHGNPVGAVPITLTALPDSAALDTSAVTTDAQGLAQVILHTSPEAGDNEVQATVADVPLGRFVVIGHQPTSLQITPQTVDVAMRGSYRFRAMATDAAGHTIEVVPDWTVVGVSGTISADGNFTATTLDTDVILASYAGLSTGALLTVVPGEIAMLQVTPAEVTVVSGTTHQFDVTAFNAHRYPLEIVPTWQVTNEIGSIDTSGLFSAAKAGNGEIVVTAGGVTGRAQVTVTEGDLATIVVSPDSLEVQAGEELQLQAIGRDAAGNQVPIDPTWKLTANLGELDASGRFRAKYTGQGRIQVEAGDKPIVVSVPVEVRPAALDRIEVEPQTLTLSAGDTIQFTATGFDTFGNIVDITPSWHLSSEVGDIDSQGELVARKVGSATVQVAVDQVSTTVSLVVKPGELASLTIEPEGPLTLAAGDTVTVTAIGHDVYGNSVALTPTWTQAEPLVNISQEGLFRAEKVGSSTLEVQSGELIASLQIDIVPGKLAKIVVTPAEITLSAGDSVTFSATGYDAYENQVEIQPNWRVENRLGEINQSGEFMARQAQTGHVVVTALGVSESAQVTVEAGPLTHLEVTPHFLDILAGETAQITIVGYDTYGNPVPTQPVWHVTPGLGTMTPDGLLTAAKAGVGRIIAAVSHLAVVVDLTVAKGPLATLRIEPPAVEVVSGQQHTFTLQGFDRGGNPVEVEPSWEVHGDIGSIDAEGRFTATLTGAGTVAASVGSVHTEARLTVKPGEAAVLKLTPESATLVAGERIALHSEAFDAAGNLVPVDPTWTVEHDLGVISSDHMFRARRAGSGKIVANIGAVQQTITIQVEVGPLATVSLLPAELVIGAGEQQTFSALGYDAYGNSMPVEPTWSVQGGIGRIDPQQGLFHPTTTGNGAVVAVVGSIAGLALVNVEPGTAAHIQLEPQTIVLTAGEETALTVTVYDAFNNATFADVTWEQTHPLGRLKHGGFQAQRAGTTEIRAMLGDLQARTVVEVQPGPVIHLQMTPKRAELSAGETQQFRVLGYDAYDNVRETSAAWELTGDIGHLGAAGEFTAGKTGHGLITARLGELSSQAEVTVVPGPVQRLVITPSQAGMPATTVQEFAAVGIDQGGNQRPIAVNWAMTEGLGALEQSGHFTAAHVGTGTVVGYTTTLVGSAEVTVTPGSVALLFVSPQRTTITAGETETFQVQGFDAHHNPIPELLVHWSMVGDIGVIDAATGLFKAQRHGWGKIQATVEHTHGSADVLVAHGLPDVQQSRMVASRVQVVADGKTTADIIVVVRDRYGNPVPEAQVTLISSREDHIDQPRPSNQHGVAVGRIRSTKPGQSEINAVVESTRVSNSLRLTFHAPAASG